MVILDTCAIIELYKEDVSLSEKTLAKIDQGALVFSVSFAEIACKLKAKKLVMSISVEDIYNDYLQLSYLEIIDISVQNWFDGINLNWPVNKDPVDLLITSYACKHKLPIITSDKKIKQFYKNTIW